MNTKQTILTGALLAAALVAGPFSPMGFAQEIPANTPSGALPPPPFENEPIETGLLESEPTDTKPTNWSNPDLEVDEELEANRDGVAETPLEEIEAYLQGLTDMQAEFVLIGPNYQTSHGQFFLSKPGRLRFDYDPPDELLVVSDGKTISLVDYELRQVTRWPIKKTPLRPLVRSGEVFGNDVTITNIRQFARQIRVSIAESGEEDEGAMELVFSRNPLKLDGWEIVDARGNRTIIALNNLRTDVVLGAELWTFDDPRPKRRNRPGKR